MDLGDLVMGVLAGMGVGVAAGMCVPPEKKPNWAKKATNKVRDKWNKYDKLKAELAATRKELAMVKNVQRKEKLTI